MASNDVMDFGEFKEFLKTFAKERDWEQFHTPKNLAMALSVEASELMEIFQWETPEGALQLKDDPAKKQAVSEEVADVLVYAIRLATVLDINLSEAIKDKMAKNAKKYPAETVRGSSKKYDQY